MDSYLGVDNAFLERLEKMSQEHEKHIVIDLSIERLIRFMGTYGIGVLAIAAAAFIILGPVLTCDAPSAVNNIARAEFTNSFCWSSSSSANEVCQDLLPIDNSTTLLHEHETAKYFYRVFPYLLIAQVIVFMLPWAYWHFRMGARLTGQLNYMKLFLKQMTNLLDKVERGVYNGKPFDKNSTSFDGEEKYKRPTQAKPVEEIEEETANQAKPAEEVDEAENENHEDKLLEPEKSENVVIKVTEEKAGDTKWDKLKRKIGQTFFGDLKDRHLFSIFCYENFSSLENLPYILSVFEASYIHNERPGEEPQVNYYALNTCILYQWCHPENFSNTRLVAVYFTKQALTALLAFLNLTGMLLWFLISYMNVDVVGVTIYRCYLPHEQKCVLCTINRTRDVFFLFWFDFSILFCILSFTIYHWRSIKNSTILAKTHYFERIKKTCNVAFEAAHSQRKMKK